jgi:hypothetical protein
MDAAKAADTLVPSSRSSWPTQMARGCTRPVSMRLPARQSVWWRGADTRTHHLRVAEDDQYMSPIRRLASLIHWSAMSDR